MTHIIQQATVIAASILSDVPSEYTAKPFVISGSCKRETVADQERLLRAATTSLRKSQEVNKRRIYCVASDGVRATAVGRDAVLAGDLKVIRLLSNTNLPSRGSGEERIRILLQVWANIQGNRYNK